MTEKNVPDSMGPIVTTTSANEYINIIKTPGHNSQYLGENGTSTLARQRLQFIPRRWPTGVTVWVRERKRKWGRQLWVVLGSRNDESETILDQGWRDCECHVRKDMCVFVERHALIPHARILPPTRTDNQDVNNKAMHRRTEAPTSVL